MEYLIGIDIGTSGTKSVLFDLDGTVIASATEEYPMDQPQNGWAEQDPEDWWQAVCKTLRAITAKATDGVVVGIGLSGQMHSIVLLDQNNRVIRPSILWCDQRTAKECEEMERTVGKKRLVEITANPAMTGFSASKLMWIRKHEPENFARCAHILLAKDYVRFRLTGEYATEVSDASGMQLLDVPKRQWSREVCDALGIDMYCLGKVYESPEVTGHITEQAARLTGLPVGTPVAGGAGDNAAAAIGTGVYCAGKAFTTIGTSGVVFAPTDRPILDPEGRVHTCCAAVPGTWHMMGVMQAAGLSLNWFRRTVMPNASYPEIDRACEGLPVGSDRLLFLPHLMGTRVPTMDADARGVFFGLSSHHTAEHMGRAVMEGISYALYECLDLLGEIGISIDEMVLCGGGAKSPFWQQMLCDLYGVPVQTMVSGEGAALGAAILGGCAAGVYASVGEGCRRAVRIQQTHLPDAAKHEEYMRFYHVYRGLYPVLRDSFRQLKLEQSK